MTTKMKQVQIHEYGSPDVLKLSEVDIPEPDVTEAHKQLEARKTTGKIVLTPNK